MDGPTILALARNTSGHYHGAILAGLLTRVHALGGHLLVVHARHPADSDEGPLRAPHWDLPVAWDRIDGVVALTRAVDESQVRSIIDRGKPVVLASEKIPGVRVPVALPDNRGGIKVAVDHLLAHGHRDIGFVGDIRQHDYRVRLDAFGRALEAHGLTPKREHLIAAESYTREAGQDAARRLLARGAPPTAVVAANDLTAIGFAEAIQGMGLRVPNDIAVIGFDDTEDGRFAQPSLTSAAVRFDLVGGLAGGLIMRLVSGAHVEPGSYLAQDGTLFPRASCGCTRPTLEEPPTSRAWPLPTDDAELAHQLGTTLEGRNVPDAAHGIVRQAVAELVGRRPAPRAPHAGARADALMHALDRIEWPGSARQHVDRVVLEHLERLLAVGESAPDAPTSPDAAAREAISLTVARLWRIRARDGLHSSRRARATEREYGDVAASLLHADTADLQAMTWLAGTSTRAGLLALWEGPPSEGRLRISGMHDPLDLLAGSLTPGDVVDSATFPPRALVESVDAAGGEVCQVIPVHTLEREWGLLVVLGRVDIEQMREPYHHWMVLVGAAQEGAELAEAVRRSEERYAHVVRAANDGLWELDLTDGSFYLSARCRELLGIPEMDSSEYAAAWTAVVVPDDRPGAAQVLTDAIDNPQGVIEIEYRIQHDAAERWVLARALAVQGEDGEPVRIVGTLSDIHRRRVLEDQLRHSALHDALTGLGNRRLLVSRLHDALRSHVPWGALFCDLDGFKQVNDTLGHGVGDEVLRVISTRLVATAPPDSTVVRLGGDEFCLLVTAAAHEDGAVLEAALQDLARRIEASVARPIATSGGPVSLTTSVGMTSSTVGHRQPEDVLDDADAAMYAMKKRRHAVRAAAAARPATAAAEVDPLVGQSVEAPSTFEELVPVPRSAPTAPSPTWASSPGWWSPPMGAEPRDSTR